MLKTFLCAFLLTGCLGAQASELKLRILQTSDLHMNLLNYDYYQDRSTDEYGLAKTIGLINAARDEAPNNLLFDNGDLLQGNPLGDVIARGPNRPKGLIHPAYKVLNLLRVDAANLGNHEFNYGLPFLREAIAGANFPYVNANVMRLTAKGQAPRHAFTPYVLLERNFKDEAGRPQRLKIGVIGLTPPQIMQWDRPNLEGQVSTRDMVEAARELIPQLRAKGADLVVAIAHTGFEKTSQPDMAENKAAELARLPGLDALLLGHAHSEFPSALFADHTGVNLSKGSIHGVPAVMPGRWGDHLGLIDLTLSRNAAGKWRVVDSHSKLRAIYRRSNQEALVAADPMVAHVIAAEHADTLKAMRAQVASSSAAIHSYFAQVQDDSSVQLVAQAQLAYMRRAVQGTELEKLPLLSAAAPFKSGGRQGFNNYTDIPAGPILAKHVADLYVYPNTIKALKLSGAEVREWLEMSAGQFRRIDPAGPPTQELLDGDFRAYNFDSIEGITYEIDVTQAARYDAEGRRGKSNERRIVNMQYQGRPLDEQAQFLVVTNNYRAHGGGNFPGLNAGKIVVDAPDETRQALSQYLSQAGHFNPSADVNWRIRPVPGIQLHFVSGAGGLAYLPGSTKVKLVRMHTDGSAMFELTP
ncbi:bifunctional 2',3'-cyclic-nucleotide 2'-phosphodiesterase/3'-nucleotidase [Roseateles oligotrophus]|uniref:Bifunctional 2',3'-cyclic-nucleotide 2'-phosphodiesterase/3'-nucleotidase n=1 Tax=Roseateles oligotrophus TaxID=1769250 RepID=A0ABT2YG79_9BURK|nr:bifunctional 2',3'-cyclic-nucleotide 2'-phosphodiesterase/3'-nucleotidase [Roseateles oligotrophus]MCV2369060.1 bifunctional 2',3'-cyclic-nucleotide 2'-phosphodiesterase/3'-nucleotidase [Roseateles oligotrophus]